MLTKQKGGHQPTLTQMNAVVPMGQTEETSSLSFQGSTASSDDERSVLLLLARRKRNTGVLEALLTDEW